jgi:hypothetical protein
MRWIAGVVFVLVALTASTTEAAGEHIVILGGGKTAEDAQAWQKRWQAIEPLLSDFVTLPEGYPQLAESKNIPGLNPGFHIVVLGSCGEQELAPVLALLKPVYPGAYARPVTKPVSGKCPSIKKEAAVVKSHSFKKDGQRLVGMLVSLKEAVAHGQPRTDALRILLFDDKDTLQAFERFDLEPTDGTFPQECTVTLEGTKSRITVETSCQIEAPACSGYVSSFKDRDVYTVEGGKISTASKHLEKRAEPYCD